MRTPSCFSNFFLTEQRSSGIATVEGALYKIREVLVKRAAGNSPLIQLPERSASKIEIPSAKPRPKDSSVT